MALDPLLDPLLAMPELLPGVLPEPLLAPESVVSAPPEHEGQATTRLAAASANGTVDRKSLTLRSSLMV